MPIKNEDVLPVLEALIEKCHALEITYAQTARCLSHETLKARCIFLWQERAQLVQDLMDKIRAFGGSVDFYETSGDEAWDVPLDLTVDEQNDLLAEGAEGDEEMVIEYNRALRLSLPIDVQILLMKHRSKLQTGERMGLLDQLVHNSARRDILAQATRN